MAPSQESVASFNATIQIPTHDHKPDGRPLYAYKFSNRDYEKLKRLLILLFSQNKKNGFQRHLAALFCLFAAETWRRNHAGGPWKWETVFNALGRGQQSPAWRDTTISNGLDWWGRPILLGQGGSREFLITIACEGGLPLRLLQNENNPLREYFRILMTEYHRDRHRTDCDIDATARRCAIKLPPSLQHDIVYKLSGDLIKPIVDLQEKVKDAPDPIAALDHKTPDWRNQLPLPLDDETTESLLKNLVKTARGLAVTEQQQIRWQRLLLQKGEAWRVEQLLNLPRQFSGATLRSLRNSNDNSILPVRMRLLLQKNGENEQVAILTRQKGEGENSVYGCEVLKRNGVCLTDKEVLQEARLLLDDGVKSHEIRVQGENEPGPLPWVFRQIEGRREFIGEGSMRCRDEKVLVLVPQGGLFEGTGCATKKGVAEGLDREVYDVSGLVEWQHPELGSCHIRCAAAHGNEGFYSFYGSRLSGVAEDTPPFLGMPSVFFTNTDGANPRRAETGLLQWRPVGFHELSWNSDDSKCAGVVWVRYCDNEGHQLLLRKVNIVPENTQIRIETIGSGANEAGKIQLSGLGDCTVTCDNSLTGSKCTVLPETNGLTTIECIADTELPVTQFGITLSWPDRSSLALHLPFPRQGAAFVRAGKALAADKKIVLSRLAGYHAVAQSPKVGRYSVTAKACSPNKFTPIHPFAEQFSLNADGRGQFDLYRIQDRLSSMMALTGDLDAYTSLEIKNAAGHSLANTRVERFDLKFVPDYDNKTLSLSNSAYDLLEAGPHQELIVTMMQLWNPEAEPLILERTGSASAWHIPDTLEAGPWLILGEIDGLPRCRPVCWQIDGETILSGSNLAQAVREQDNQERKEQLKNVLWELAKDPNHPDWPLFFGYLRMSRRYPASVFDVLSKAITIPHVMIAALLHSNEEDFNLVWDLSAQLPFSWYLIPVSAWKEAISQYFDTLTKTLSAMNDGKKYVWEAFQRFRERIIINQPFFQQVCDWLSAFIFPDQQPDGGNIIAVARQAPDFLLNCETGLIANEERKLQERHGADEHYPDGEKVMGWQKQPHFPQNFRYKHLSRPFRPVRCAPFVAADIAFAEKKTNEDLLFELQELRDFDTEWFDSAYAFGLCLRLANLP